MTLAQKHSGRRRNQACPPPQFVHRLNPSAFDHFEQNGGCLQYVGKGAVTPLGERHAEPLAQYIQAVAERLRVQALAQSHGAQALRQLHVAPAEFFLALQESHVERRVMREEPRAFGKSQELGQHGHDGRRTGDIGIGNTVDLPCLRRNRPLRIHERGERTVGDDAPLDAHACDFDDAMTFARVEPGRFNVEDGQSGERHARYTSSRMRRTNGIPLPVVLNDLKRLYAPPKTFLDYRTPLDLLVAVILSAQCTDAMVNRITAETLYPKYATPRDYLRVPREELEQDIRRSGHFRAKAQYIQETCQMLLDQHGGEVPRTMEELTALRGVGRKTASVVLSAVFGINAGIAVDTHVQRLSQRLGLSTHHEPTKIELDLMEAVPQTEWRNVTTLLISHGRAVCTALHRKCGACVFKDRCPSSLVLGRSDLAKPKKAKGKPAKKV